MECLSALCRGTVSPQKLLSIGKELLIDDEGTEDDDCADRSRFAGDGVTDCFSFETLPKACWKFVDIDRDAFDVHACIIDDVFFLL